MPADVFWQDFLELLVEVGDFGGPYRQEAELLLHAGVGSDADLVATLARALHSEYASARLAFRARGILGLRAYAQVAAGAVDRFAATATVLGSEDWQPLDRARYYDMAALAKERELGGVQGDAWRSIRRGELYISHRGPQEVAAAGRPHRLRIRARCRGERLLLERGYEQVDIPRGRAGHALRPETASRGGRPLIQRCTVPTLDARQW
ncbi:hypothetical protein ABT187_36845 [Streptomyces sp. NPDC001817]|uniref:hypothetical protein n=1 Tax=Streptomyces sp. NPDC001817 TaxID=3154398 RepID=UPI003324328C